MDFDEVLKRRRSSRRFQDAQIKKAELDQILLAGCSAPVGSNLYRDLHMTVVQNKKILHALNAAFEKRLQDREAMKKIAGDMPRTARDVSAILPFYGAPTVIILSHRRQDLQPGIEYANTSCVAMAMHLAAANLGLGSVLAWGVFEAMRIFPELDNSALLGLPEGFVPLMGSWGISGCASRGADLDPKKIASTISESLVCRRRAVYVIYSHAGAYDGGICSFHSDGTEKIPGSVCVNSHLKGGTAVEPLNMTTERQSKCAENSLGETKVRECAAVRWEGAEKSLPVLLKKLEILSSISSIGYMVTGLDGTIISFSKTVEELLGIGADAYRNANVSDIYADPNDRKRLLGMLPRQYGAGL